MNQPSNQQTEDKPIETKTEEVNYMTDEEYHELYGQYETSREMTPEEIEMTKDLIDESGVYE